MVKHYTNAERDGDKLQSYCCHTSARDCSTSEDSDSKLLASTPKNTAITVVAGTVQPLHDNCDDYLFKILGRVALMTKRLDTYFVNSQRN